MKRFAPIAVAVVILAVAGIYEAVRASRLSSLQSSGVPQAKLDAIPMKFGDWTGEPREFDEKMLKATKAIAHLSRRYTRSGPKPAVVDILILAGEPGEIGAHDPERCYGGTGHKPRGSRTKKQIADGGNFHTVWAQRFDRDTLPALSMEVAWGWTDGHWQAAEDARTAFFSDRLLYKIYVSRAVPVAAEITEASDVSADLLNALIPLARPPLAGAKP